MYLHETNANNIAMKQFRFILRTNISIFTILFILQIISSIFMLGSWSSSSISHSYDTISVSWNTFSNDGIVGLTLFWAMVVGILLTASTQRDQAFTFVTNRWTYHLGNLYFFCFAAMIGGASTILLSSVPKVYGLLRYDSLILETTGLLSSPMDFISRFIVMTMYTFLVLIVGYTIGMFIQLNRLFIVVIASLFILINFVLGYGAYYINDRNWFAFFTEETSLLLFIMKMLSVASILFLATAWATNRLEVRK